MSQQSVRQAARRSALDAQAVLRKERADQERRIEGLAVAVLTALRERDALVREAEQRAGQALRTMTDEEGLSLREAELLLRRLAPIAAPDAVDDLWATVADLVWEGNTGVGG